MVIKKNFKVISDGKTEYINSQEIIQVSEQEINDIKENLSTFFSSIKVLLREGAVIIDDGKTPPKDEEEIEEEFLNNPNLNDKQQLIFAIALGILPDEKKDEFMRQIKGLTMTEDFDFKIDTERESELKSSLEKIISKEMKSYSQELPAIMQERAEKIKLMIEARPDIKLYLEGKK
jgi:hypothetical protein